MPEPRVSTLSQAHACRDALAWLGRQARWDQRLTELQALAADPVEPDLLDAPGRSEGVYV